jgi:hypothetical protein
MVAYRRYTVRQEFVPRGQTVNGQFYLEVMKRLRQADRKKSPEGVGKQDLEAAPRQYTCSHVAPRP